jgi:hypothetical protein
LPELSGGNGLDRYVERRALPTLGAADVERLVAVHVLDHWLASIAP